VVAWTGAFDLLKGVMTYFVLLIVGGALYAAVHVFTGLGAIAQSLAFRLPEVPAWALAQGVQANPWREIMPLLGWGAGGFASQVWYTYWVLGAGYGSAAGRGYGQPADTHLGRMTRAAAEKVKGWCHVVYADATIALVIGVVVTGAFVLAGYGVLRVQQIIPKGDGVELAGNIATIFSTQWGALGGTVFLVAAVAALVGTLLGQLAGAASWRRFPPGDPGAASAFRVADAVPLLPRPVLLHEHGRRLRDAEEPDRDRAHGGVAAGSC
jgi:hypothetical protein